MLFSVEKEKKNGISHLTFLLIIVLISLFIIFTNYMTSSQDTYSRQVLENALSRSITQCYALEGTYPPNLKYLVDNYGLTYDKDHFYIDYTYIGSNLRPDVTIIEKEEL